jgi:acetoin utilization deacetylase AcuC-like enzyme
MSSQEGSAKRLRRDAAENVEEAARAELSSERVAFRVGLVTGVRQADVLPINAGRAALVDGLIDSLALPVERIPAATCAWSNIELHHDPDYTAALRLGVPDERFGLAFDGHPFPGLAEHCQAVAGATLSAAQWLLRAVPLRDANDRTGAVAINWHGGRHHARAAEASGWCFVNDAVLAMLLLRRAGLRRLAYVDVDVHAGDAVEEVSSRICHFNCSSSRQSCDEEVFFASLHLHEPGFFPFPGGAVSAAPNVLNVPLRRGLSDASLLAVFEERVVPRLVAHQPEAIILQLGADGLAGDPVGLHWNLTPASHCALVRRAKQLCRRVVLLGGGGYHHTNTARCWAAATHAALDSPAPSLPGEVPASCPVFESFGPDFAMHVRPFAHLTDENAL